MSADESILSSRLDQINTRWSLVRRAHAASPDSVADTRNALVLRYSAAIRNYIGAMPRNEED